MLTLEQIKKLEMLTDEFVDGYTHLTDEEIELGIQELEKHFTVHASNMAAGSYPIQGQGSCDCCSDPP